MQLELAGGVHEPCDVCAATFDEEYAGVLGSRLASVLPGDEQDPLSAFIIVVSKAHLVYPVFLSAT